MFGHAGDYSAVRASDNIEETTVIGSTTMSVKGVAEEPTRQRQTWCAYACFVRKVNGFRDLNALRDDLMELKPTLFAGVPRSKVTFDGLVTCTMFIQTRFHAKDELACKAMCKMLISIESGHELVTMHNEVARLCEAMLAYIIREARKRIVNILEKNISERRSGIATHHEDFLQQLLDNKLNEDGVPADKEIKDNILPMIIAVEEVIPDPTHVLELDTIQVHEDLTNET
ncbi:hypothetical protein JHK82_027435 [Glycine max]|nr:hypothetical protein JHK82_027435 [Glycine max]